MNKSSLENNTIKASARSAVYTTIGWSAFIVAVLTFASRVVGLLRIRIFASTFGAGHLLDTYYAAFRIPDFLMGVLIVGTLSIAALPIVSQYMFENESRGHRLVANLLNWTFLTMAFLCALAAVFAPWLVHLVVPGFTAQEGGEVVQLTRIILIAQVLLSVGNVAATALNAVKRFFWAGFAPITYNLGLIVGVVWLYPYFGLPGLGYGVILGAAVHLLTQLIDLRLAGFRLMPVLTLDKGMRAILRLYLPRLFTLDLSQVSLLLASIFGSLLSAGSIAVFSLGFDIQAVPVGVFAIAVATATFPHLSDHYSKKDLSAFAVLLREAIVRILFFMLPIAVALLLLRAHAVRILYGAGEFSWDNTRATFSVLGVLTFSLIGQSLVPLFARALLARHNTWAPVLGNILSVLVTVVVALFCVPQYGISGVAAGYAAGMTFNAILLYAWLRPELKGEGPDAGVVLAREEYALIRDVWKILSATLAFAFTVYGALYALAPLVDTRTWFGLAVQAAASGCAGALVYFGVAKAVKLPDAQALERIVQKVLKTCGKTLKLIK